MKKISINNSHKGAELFTELPPRRIQLIGREKELTALELTLNTSKRVALVNNIDGVGKTELCKAFFYKHYNEYRYAAWVDWMMSLRESLVYALGNEESGFIQVGEKDTDAERFKKIVERFCQIREPMLLVLDNIESPEDKNLVALASLPPEIKILASSRSHIDRYEELRLELLSPAEFKELFYMFYKENPDDESVEKVVALCGYQTSTVELLARTAHHAAMSVETLYNTLKSKGFNLNEVTEKKTFFDHLVKLFDISSVTEGELNVLSNMSVLPAVYIRMEWVKEWLELNGIDEIVSLVEKGWLKRDEESRIYLIPVMQKVVMHKTKPNAKKCRVLIRSLANTLSCEPHENPIYKKEYLMYGESVMRGMDAEEKDEMLAKLANNISVIFLKIGQLDRALEFQLKSLKMHEAILEPNHPSLATSYNNASTIYQALGQFNRALEFQLRAIKIVEEALGKNHPSLATSYHNLSLVYQKMNENPTALKYAEKAVAILQFNFPGGHPNLKLAKKNLENLKSDSYSC